ncbi:hypothetical protein TanjilG_32390, partial [Lupinus angustifolius]
AEIWVNNMSQDADDGTTYADIEGRPSRLGLGAKISRQSKVGPSDDPVDRKLYAKLGAEKRKRAKIAEESTTVARDDLDDSEDDEQEERYEDPKMSVAEKPKKVSSSQIVKLDKALKLAEIWVNNMSQDADDGTTYADIEGRPSRLGLGAKISRQSKVGPSDDPVDRKLYAKLGAEKRKRAKIAEESTTVARDDLDDSEDDEQEESRTSAFSKRKTVPLRSPILGNKKQK